MAPPSHDHAPVFIDQSGKRWRRVRRVAVVVGIATTLLGLVLAVSILAPPLLPELHPLQAATLHKPVTTKEQRERNLWKRRLAEAVSHYFNPPRARHPENIRIRPVASTKPMPRGKPVIAGFYVNWDDNSFASLQRNLRKMDWVVLEWAVVAPGGDSLQISIDPRVIQLMRITPRDVRPKLLVMVSNFDTTQKTFRSPTLRNLLTRPAARARAIGQLDRLIAVDSLGGVVVDFEEVPGLQPYELRFNAELHAAMKRRKAITASAVASYVSDQELRDAASVNDALFVMLFDEHYGTSTPGPIASQQFYEQRARKFASVVPPQKLILMLAAYGYDWNDIPPEPGQTKSAEERTFQDIVTALRDSGAVMHFDSVSLNPFITYSSPDSTDHVVWFLDGATAYNQMKVAEAVGAGGSAVWRLGSEDPSLWRSVDAEGVLQNADSLEVVPPGYYPEIEANGEILRVRTRPTSGTRRLHVDALSGLVNNETFTSYSTPYIVQRYGVQDRHPHWVALTFDDGPSDWTPSILDTLASRGVKATFFVIGVNAEAHPNTVRREYSEGHEIGNHTWSHPNLGLTSTVVTRIEIDANERLLEALLNRRTALFRAPYFGDAEPTTSSELVPIAIASEKNYLTVGLHVDSEDWRDPPPDSIIANVLASRPDPDMPDSLATCRDTLGRKDSHACNVVLLHDGGGVRANTLAALGRLIDSLKARGDTLVLASQLVGLDRDRAMPPVPAVGQLRRVLEIGGFQLLGGVEWLMFWVFSIAVALGIGRLVIIGALAVIQRIERHQRRGEPTPYAPPVSVIVPAYNEEKVVVRTVQSLLMQQYEGDLEVVVVDDGSKDTTFATAREAFRGNSRVTVLTKPNGGKASALNFGLARARHEVVICLDADTIFAGDTVSELVQPLADPEVGAVAGNAKVGNRINIVTRWQALEYVTSQNLDRRAFSLLDCITVVPGAVGAWRRTVVQQAGGFRSDTLAEDQDLTLSIRRAGYSVAYADGAVAQTEAPDTLRTLARQRFRWSFGTLQCAWKHRDALFRPRYGSLGWVALPNVWLFQLLLPALSPIADLMFVWSLASVWLTKQEHGGTYALTNLEQVMTYYAVFLLVDWAAAMIGFLMEPGEDRSLSWLIFIQRFAYRQVMYWVVVRSFAAALRGRVVGWGKLDRKATVGMRPDSRLRRLITRLRVRTAQLLRP